MAADRQTDTHTDARDHNTFCVVYDSYAKCNYHQESVAVTTLMLMIGDRKDIQLVKTRKPCAVVQGTTARCMGRSFCIKWISSHSNMILSCNSW